MSEGMLRGSCLTCMPSTAMAATPTRQAALSTPICFRQRCRGRTETCCQLEHLKLCRHLSETPTAALDHCVAALFVAQAYVSIA